MRGRPPLTLLTIFCYMCRQEAGKIVIRKASSSNRWKHGQRPKPNIRWSLENPVQEREEGVKEPEGSRTPQENIKINSAGPIEAYRR